MNMTIIKVVSSMFKKHKLFSLGLVVTKIYWFKIFHFLLIFGLWNCDHGTARLQTWCPYNLYLHPSRAQISTFHVHQPYSYKRINKFSRQKWQFFLKFRVSKSRSRDLVPQNRHTWCFWLLSYYIQNSTSYVELFFSYKQINKFLSLSIKMAE